MTAFIPRMTVFYRRGSFERTGEGPFRPGGFPRQGGGSLPVHFTRYRYWPCRLTVLKSMFTGKRLYDMTPIPPKPPFRSALTVWVITRAP